MAEYSREWIEDVDRRFGERVKAERERAGMSQQHIVMTLLLLHGIKWHQSTVTKLENGTRPVRLVEALAVAAVLDVDLNDLLDEPRAPGGTHRRRLEGRLLELSDLQSYAQTRLDKLRRRYDAGEGDDDGEHQKAP